MAGTKKVSISMSEGEYRALESARRKAGRSRSQFIREALEARGVLGGGGAKASKGAGPAKDAPGSSVAGEERGPYRFPPPPDIVDGAELRRRAIEAAGKLESGVPDLSVGHDRYLADADAADLFASKRVGWLGKGREKP
jgi:hypothetical protein